MFAVLLRICELEDVTVTVEEGRHLVPTEYHSRLLERLPEDAGAVIEMQAIG